MKSKTKISGAINRSLRASDKRLSQRGGEFSATTVAGKDEEEKVSRVSKKSAKAKAQTVRFANVIDRKSKKPHKAEITTVIENTANRHYMRRNIITRGAIIAIKFGNEERQAKVTSRPGQVGTVDAVLLEKSEEARKEDIEKKLREEEKRKKATERKHAEHEKEDKGTAAEAEKEHAKGKKSAEEK